MFDMMKMMGKVKEAQSKMKEVQAGLANITTEGEAGAGMVKAVVNGKKQLIDLIVDESLYNPDDKDMLKDLIIAATNIAMEKADLIAREEMKKATEGMLPNIPGLDLSGMM